MNTEVLSVRDDMTVQELATFLTEREILGAPVVDGEGEVIGVVSCTDIAQNAVRENQAKVDFFGQGWEEKIDPEELQDLPVENESLPVREIMTPHHLHGTGGHPHLRNCQGNGGGENSPPSGDPGQSTRRDNHHA